MIVVDKLTLRNVRAAIEVLDHSGPPPPARRLVITQDERVALTAPDGVSCYAIWDLAEVTVQLLDEQQEVVIGDQRYPLGSVSSNKREYWVACLKGDPHHDPTLLPAASSPRADGGVATPGRESQIAYVPGTPVTGQNGAISVTEYFVEITRSDLAQDLMLGNLRGTKSIPLHAVQAVQLKKATKLVGGALEVVVAGDHSNTGQDMVHTGNSMVDSIAGRRLARMGAENVITFTLTQEPRVLGLHHHLLEALKFAGLSPRAAKDRQPGAADLVSRIERLRDLLSDGTLTEDEFTVAKAKLLSE